MNPVCKTCKFLHPWGLEPREGECRRNAPLAKAEEGLGARAFFPRVWVDTTWCGEHRPVEAETPHIVKNVCGGCFHHRHSHQPGHPYGCRVSGCSCTCFDERPQPEIDAGRSRITVCNECGHSVSEHESNGKCKRDDCDCSDFVF